MGSLFLFIALAVLFSLTTFTRSSVVIDIEKLVAGIPDKPVVLASQLVVGDDDSIIDSVDSSAEEFPEDSVFSDSDESSESDECEEEEDDGLYQISKIPEKQKSPHVQGGLQAKTTTIVVHPGRIKGSSKNTKRRADLDQFPENLLVDIFYRMMSGNIGLERAWRNMAKLRVLNKRMSALMEAVLERLSVDHPFFANQMRLIAIHKLLSHPRLSYHWTTDDQKMYDWLEKKSMFPKYMRTFIRQNIVKSLLFDTSIPTAYLLNHEAQTIKHSLWCVSVWVGAAMIVLFAEYFQERGIYTAFFLWAMYNAFYIRYCLVGRVA